MENTMRPLALVIFGESGHGKSRTANLMLQKSPVFSEHDGYATQVKQVEHYDASSELRIIEVPALSFATDRLEQDSFIESVKIL